jgi:hypothetical protein
LKALVATKAGDSEEAAKAHVKAAKVHDAMEQKITDGTDDYKAQFRPGEARRHKRAAMWHRKAAVLHLLAQGDPNVPTTNMADLILPLPGPAVVANSRSLPDPYQGADILIPPTLTRLFQHETATRLLHNARQTATGRHGYEGSSGSGTGRPSTDSRYRPDLDLQEPDDYDDDEGEEDIEGGDYGQEPGGPDYRPTGKQVGSPPPNRSSSALFGWDEVDSNYRERQRRLGLSTGVPEYDGPDPDADDDARALAAYAQRYMRPTTNEDQDILPLPKMVY